MEILTQLQAEGVITPEAFTQVTTAVANGETIESALLKTGLGKSVILSKIAAFYGVPGYEPEDGYVVPQNVLAYIPVEAAKNYSIVPIKVDDDTLLVGTNDPEDFRLREVMNFVSAKHSIAYKFVFVLAEDLKKMLTAYDNLNQEVDDALVTLEGELDKEIEEKRFGTEGDQSLSQDHIKEDAPVTKVVATILRYAVDGKASDIHIEPTSGKLRVRFRVDGILNTSLELPMNVHSAVVARIKILSSSRLDERRKPQDGRFSATFDGRKIDFRVSILPTNYGEKVVMRILDNEKGIRTLEDTGIAPKHLQTIRRMIQEPYGIILISGPTGSGKSTTLYAMLSEVDVKTKNVLSLEDPIEYNIEGVSQSQVRPEIGYTFANGLRSALRQDPDVIMVGEIRDKETAQLAIQAALTGHLVLSTIHTNNAIGVIPRLIDMGVDPYLIAPVLKLAIAQRLAKRLCPGAGKAVPVDLATKTLFDHEFETLPSKYHTQIPKFENIYHPESAPGCASGTKGRVAVMEVLEIDAQIQELILKNGSEEDMFNVARNHQGFMTMKEDAIIKALGGMIPYEEVNAFGTKVGMENEPIPEIAPVPEIPAVDNPEPAEDNQV